MRTGRMSPDKKNRPQQEKPRIKREREKTEADEIVDDVRDFVQNTVPEIDYEKADKIPPKQLVHVLMEYWNEPASFEHFKTLLNKYAPEKYADVKPSDVDRRDDISSLWVEYLMNKLPFKLREKFWKEQDEGTFDVNKLFKTVSDKNTGIVLGFHTSPEDFWKGEGTKVKRAKDAIEFRDAETGETREMEGLMAYYSTDPNQLYQKRAPKYLYFVEGHRADVNSKRNYSPKKKAFISRDTLTARWQIPLNQEAMNKLGLKFGNY